MTTRRHLIAPVTERWNEGERDWSHVVDPQADIAAWERRTRLRLPDGYRRFMCKFNGGHVYPRRFRHTVPLERYPSTEPVTILDPLYAWARVEAHWRGETYGRGNPPGMLFIGGDPGGLQLLLSLRPADFGQLFCWPHTTNIWGTDGNTETWHQADSFEAFLDSLFDDAQRSDFAAWKIPAFVRLARPLEF